MSTPNTTHPANNVILRGLAAISYADALGGSVMLRKYADPIEPDRLVTIDEAREIARQDPSLIWFEAKTDHPDHASIMAGL